MNFLLTSAKLKKQRKIMIKEEAGFMFLTLVLSTLVISTFASCPNNCIDSSHGSCIGNHCVCRDNWAGEDCSFGNYFFFP